MKKLLSLLLVIMMVFTIAGCSSNEKEGEDVGEETSKQVKIGIVLIGDENEGYSLSHINGIKAAAEKNGISADQLVWKYNIGESEVVTDTENDLIEEGCSLIIANSYGHESFTLGVANENPDITFVNMTGDNMSLAENGNYSNAFTHIYEARYVAGVVAGLKLKQLIEEDKLGPANYDAGYVKIGYVSAYPYAECISGFTSYFLGVRSIVENVKMAVNYTNSWGDFSLENKAAKALIDDGCVIISQHADTDGAPSAVQEARENGKEVYCVGYNVSNITVAPDAALVSSTNHWEIYYDYLFSNFLAGNKIDDWHQGFAQDAVRLTELSNNVVPGTEEKVNEVINKIKSGELRVFDCSTFTIDGQTPTSILADVDGDFVPETEGVIDGYFHESEFRSAPYFAANIDGIVNAGEIK